MTNPTPNTEHPTPANDPALVQWGQMAVNTDQTRGVVQASTTLDPNGSGWLLVIEYRGARREIDLTSNIANVARQMIEADGHVDSSVEARLFWRTPQGDWVSLAQVHGHWRAFRKCRATGQANQMHIPSLEANHPFGKAQAALKTYCRLQRWKVFSYEQYNEMKAKENQG